MTYEALFVDLDDTLYAYPECNEAGKQAAWERSRELGYGLSREAFDDLYMEARWDVKRDTAGTAASHERYLYFKRAVRLHDGSHGARDAVALGDAYWEAYLDEMALFEGVEETLTALQDAGIDVAVLSNLTTRIQLEKVDRLGLEQYVDLLWTSEEAGREKPASVMFTLPLAQLDRRPGEVVMVGNSVRCDIEGGNAVGFTTVLFNNDATDLAAHRLPDHRIEEFRDVEEVVL